MIIQNYWKMKKMYKLVLVDSSKVLNGFDTLEDAKQELKKFSEFEATRKVWNKVKLSKDGMSLLLHDSPKIESIIIIQEYE